MNSIRFNPMPQYSLFGSRRIQPTAAVMSALDASVKLESGPNFVLVDLRFQEQWLEVGVSLGRVLWSRCSGFARELVKPFLVVNREIARSESASINC